jgi:hypothetical protein
MLLIRTGKHIYTGRGSQRPREKIQIDINPEIGKNEQKHASEQNWPAHLETK